MTREINNEENQGVLNIKYNGLHLSYEIWFTLLRSLFAQRNLLQI